MFHLCADRTCNKKNSCFRFVADPFNEIKSNYATRIEATLHDPYERSCSKFYPITLFEGKAA